MIHEQRSCVSARPVITTLTLHDNRSSRECLEGDKPACLAKNAARLGTKNAAHLVTVRKQSGVIPSALVGASRVRWRPNPRRGVAEVFRVLQKYTSEHQSTVHHEARADGRR